METLPELSIGKLLLLLGPKKYLRSTLPLLTAKLALRSPLRVLDCGNSFRGYPLAREIRRQNAAVNQVLERIAIARAFTCYQVPALLAETPADGTPTLVLDLLSTFYDENINEKERGRLLALSIRHLKRISARAPLAVSLFQSTNQQADRWQEMIMQSATLIWHIEELPDPVQLTFF